MKISLLALAMMGAAIAQPARTLVSGSVYNADANALNGSITVEWPTFVSGDGYLVEASRLIVPVAGGAVSIRLVPTGGASPAFLYSVLIKSDTHSETSDSGTPVGAAACWSVPNTGTASVTSVFASCTPSTNLSWSTLTNSGGTSMTNSQWTALGN
jgi:hypothetical protein